MLSEKAKRKRAEYQRQYRQRNPDKVKKWMEDYWTRKASGQTKRTGGDDNADAKQQKADCN